MRRAAGIVRGAPPAAWALLAAAVVIVAVTSHWMLPWLTRDSYVRVATPVPPQNFGVTPIALERGKPVCIEDVLLPTATQVAGLAGSVPEGHRPPTIDVTVTAPGYSHRTTIERGWPKGLSFTLPSPSADVLASVCLSTKSRSGAILNANAGAVVRAYSTVDGERAPAAVAIELRRADPQSRLSRLGTMLDRAADLTWRPFGGGLARVLMALVLVLVPVGAIGALLWTMERDRRETTTYHEEP